MNIDTLLFWTDNCRGYPTRQQGHLSYSIQTDDGRQQGWLSHQKFFSGFLQQARSRAQGALFLAENLVQQAWLWGTKWKRDWEWSMKTQHKCCLKILMPNHLLKDLQAKLTLESHFLHFKYILTCARVCALRSPGQFDRWLLYLGSDLTHSNTVLRLYYCAEHWLINLFNIPSITHPAPFPK